MTASRSARTHDIVVYGATGFVGKLLVDYLARNAPVEVRIALAGRNEAKLAAVRAELPETARDWPLIVADAADPKAMKEMAESTKVVATTVGPYAKYGMPLVAACAEAGTDYVDLTGEAVFVRRSADEYDAMAQASGARIVHSCGFDSIPSDLGVYLTWQQAMSDNAGTLRETTLVVRKAKGGFSGGTIDSLRNQIDLAGKDKSVARVLVDPYGLSPDRAAEPPMSRDSVDNDVTAPRKDARLGQWVGPFVMASYNTRVVRRSNALLDHAYGPDFHYQEVVGFGNSPAAPVMASGMAVGLGGLVAGLRFGPTRAVLDKFLPKPGEGPSEQARNNGLFVLDIIADTTTGQRYRTRVAADGDPGYAATSMMMGEAALTLVLDRAQLPDRAGVLTPAVAMGDALIDRLRAAGMTLESLRFNERA